MPLRHHLYDQLVADREAEDRDARRVERRYWIVTLGLCLTWCALGGGLVVWGLHVVDPVNGPVALNAGASLALAGPLLTICIAGFHRSSRGYH